MKEKVTKRTLRREHDLLYEDISLLKFLFFRRFFLFV